MRLLEIVFILIVAGFLVAQHVRAVPRRYLFALAVAGLSTILLGGLLGQARWQMAPAYLLFGVLALLLLRRSFAHVAVRSLGVALGIVLLAISATASLGMPILTLPAPDGPYVVGSTSLSLIDETRDNSFFDAPDEARELYIQVWYPGTIPASKPTPRVRTLWEELYRGDRDRFTLFSSYLRGTKTHSYEDVPLSPAQASYPALIFSHAMGSFAEQNTLLMEHLASHGYVIVGISHPYASMRVVSADGRAIYLDLDKINEISAQYETVDTELTPRIERAGSPEERIQLQRELYERATGNNALMAVWVDDLRFVLDSITTQSRRHPTLQAFANRLDADRIGLLGMSFGGGAITEACKSDTRCRAGMNMDGATFGQRQRQPLEVPYLSLVRGGNRGSFVYLSAASRSDYYEVEVEGSTHLDFTDDAVVLPILKWLGVTGDIGAWRVIEITNAVSLRFFDAYLRGEPKPRFDAEFPELNVETNGYAARSIGLPVQPRIDR
jgi:predicted dienelactone hydrolase